MSASRIPPMPLSLSVVIPATNGPPTLPACLDAIARAADGPEQVIVVEDRAITHPAVARNAGALGATGDVLVFVDADVTVHREAFTRIRSAFAGDATLTALFGSYDDAPASQGLASVVRNLLHHHVHHASAGPAYTFWAGLGAVRRPAFEALGGFVAHPVEDIEFGMRLAETGARIMLDPTIQGTHLKHWSLYGMARTDLLVRGIPWVGLLLERPKEAGRAGLNLGWSHRISALACVALVGALLMRNPWIAAVAMTLLVALNAGFYGLLVRRLGLARAIAGIGVHIVHILVAVASVPLGILHHLAGRRSVRAATAERRAA